MESVTEVLGLAGYQLISARAEGPLRVLEVRPEPGPRPACPHCGAPACRQYRHGRRQRRIAHTVIGMTPCDLLVHFDRLRCQACGRTHTPPLLGVGRRARLSAGCQALVNQLLRSLQCGIATLGRWLALSWNTLWRCVTRAAPPLLEQAVHLCLDEVLFREPRQYVTVLSCADGRVLDVEPGRGAAPSRRLLARLPECARASVETLATDFNLGQRRAALEGLPQAEIVADCFHLVRLARRCVRETPPGARETARAAVRQLRQLLRHGEQPALAAWLARWRQATGPLKTLWHTVDQWELEIEGYLNTGRSTGPAEALNRRIALLRRQACGYTNLHNFITRIMLLNCSLHPQS